MNAQTQIVADIADAKQADELSEELRAIDIEEHGSGKRFILQHWYNNKSLDEKLRLAIGAPTACSAAIAFCALTNYLVPAASALVWLELLFAAMAIYAGFGWMRRLRVDTVKPLATITENMKRLADGQRDIVVEGIDRQDEIGELARALGIFLRSGHKLDELFDGRRAAIERRKKELALLADRFEQQVGEIVGGVAAASSQLQSTASSMASAAEQSTSQAGKVVDSMKEASAGVTAAAAASDEFAMSIGEISRQAASSAELARKASESAERADTTISALSDSATQVGAIVDLIQSIAKRTNLLALNASIEAARGGEAGRGFAVVASEVKELAAQTSRATEEVASQIRTMQDSTGNSVKALRLIGEQIEQLEATAISIASAVDQQSVAGQDLARSIDLAARSSDEVSSRIVEVRETAISTGAAASQVLTSATELEGQAAGMRSQVSQFLAQVREG
ncbi:MAG: HAMP domain-containing methyl-accepting chemotaxis protein [Altererythrobacter sp.]